ncbi:MAG: hypothetical protein ACLVJO_01445 [[Clostridium] scindens]
MLCQRLPKRSRALCQFKMNLLETPDTGDVTGVLTVTDITEQTISDRIMHRLSVTDYDFVVDVDLHHDTYNILSSSGKVCCAPLHRAAIRSGSARWFRPGSSPKTGSSIRHAWSLAILWIG